jgi:hypothetical protein
MRLSRIYLFVSDAGSGSQYAQWLSKLNNCHQIPRRIRGCFRSQPRNDIGFQVRKPEKRPGWDLPIQTKQYIPHAVVQFEIGCIGKKRS